MLTQTPKGTKDILPIESYKWQYVESQIAKVCANFGYKEIRTPVFEHTELFQRGVGDTTDIVQKEMYTFLDKGNRSISLRPEGTAGVVRSYIENGMSSLPQPVKLYYIISAYRYEKMAKGRYREFHQFGVETFGSKGPSIDVEIISLIKQLFDSLGLKDVGLNINSIGCPICRKEYNQKLMDYFRPSLDKLCGLCNNRFERNPLRIIDCKEEKCKTITAGAPAILDNLCEECSTHFEGLKKGLDNLGIVYNVDKNIVRGLDYYTKTVFEFISENVGTQGTICGGGRYDGLVQACGGPSTPAVGFAIGIERLLMEMESQGVPIPPQKEIEIYIATIGETSDTYAEKLIYDLRKRQIPAEKDLLQKSLKAQMKYADKLGAKYTVVLGDDEVKNNRAVLKNMKNGEQAEIALDNIHDEIINRR
ncbi:histidine--tRNA ligase [Pseudobacteroides cellulosolvens]|uniref:Histidine--tRNA ligase n=1 Tax=Pseudobacteroides cellulosolvens ATCC 35603 = DSM 2933 TaxID=398512 RepID=A0A0L6JQP6_9FIRM|nr:histidine--tRNA ligase [Pseudobacteroides cellulosolvens]KNY28108.1 Histidyl-tRNA synthetase [Pseudobacteroides cellulosolvens ATCC 35603 = DSM 2933]